MNPSRPRLLAALAALSIASATTGAALWTHKRGLLARLGLPLPGRTAYVSDFDERMRLVHARMDPSVPPGRVVLLGDSMAQSLIVQDVVPGAINYGVGGGTARALLGRLPVYRSLATASAVIVQVGINDLYDRSVAEAAAAVEDVVRALPPSAGPRSVYVHALFPLGRGFAPATAGRPSPASVRAVNEELRAFCRSACTFIDVDDLADRDGFLRREFDAGDGQHLNAAGYAAWARILQRRVLPSDPGADR